MHTVIEVELEEFGRGAHYALPEAVAGRFQGVSARSEARAFEGGRVCRHSRGCL